MRLVLAGGMSHTFNCTSLIQNIKFKKNYIHCSIRTVLTFSISDNSLCRSSFILKSVWLIQCKRWLWNISWPLLFSVVFFSLLSSVQKLRNQLNLQLGCLTASDVTCMIRTWDKCLSSVFVFCSQSWPTLCNISLKTECTNHYCQQMTGSEHTGCT